MAGHGHALLQRWESGFDEGIGWSRLQQGAKPLEFQESGLGRKNKQFEGLGSGCQGVAKPLGFWDFGILVWRKGPSNLKVYGDDDSEGQSDDEGNGQGDEFPEEVITPVCGVCGGGCGGLRGHRGVAIAATVEKDKNYNSNEER